MPLSENNKDNPIDCPDQAHWIFLGILIGLATALFILWLLNCFHFPLNTEVIRSNTQLVRQE